ncbi:sulfite reductase subunit beta [Russula ochroleuca]|uniref:assimilatory sulfite reductase (NADPH) n=1 Tax=Russula ochroleuca TaxID=152965 RepID=A0A9P5T9A9_9AGAM|nr:sulfite reductase subunit beta [Russula ochroleuca]
MLPLTPSVAAVARVVHLSSDAVVDYPSPFSLYWKSLPQDALRSTTVITLPHGSDPTPELLRQSTAALLSCTAPNSSALIRLLPHLPELSARPIVIHVVAQGDLADALVLRAAVPYFIHSSSPQQAHDNALLASRLARTERKAVVHVFHVGNKHDKVEEIAEDNVKHFLYAEKRTRTHSRAAGRAQSPVPSRPQSPIARPYSPSPTRPYSPSPKHANGHANGLVNGHSRKGGDSDGRHSPRSVTPATPTFTIPVDPITAELLEGYEAAALATLALVRRSQRALAQRGHSDPHTVIFGFGLTSLDFNVDGVAYIDVSLLSPLPSSRILTAVRPSVRHIVVLEQVQKWTTRWTPLFLDIVNVLQHRDPEDRPTVRSAYLGDTSGLQPKDVATFLQAVTASKPSARTRLGASIATLSSVPEVPHIPRHESSYTRILGHLFGERLEISNSPSLVQSQGEFATSPEFALGRIRGTLEERAELTKAIHELLQDAKLSSETHSLLSRWILVKDDAAKSLQIGDEIVAALQSGVDHPAASRILLLREHFRVRSRWIIGSDAWSHDLGASGLHHAIASGLNVNVLILDTLPYTARNTSDPNRRKHDIGLYAMNYGNAYVASIAVYSSYAQVLQALVEADRFDGPSVILAYLPYTTEESTALDLLKETKLAVDSGYWPLYRWDPSKDAAGKEPFSLDSDAVKNDLQTFLDRQNHLSQLVRAKPLFPVGLVTSLGETVKAERKKRAQKVYEELLSAIDAPPLLILYASDGGAAEKKAKQLAGRAQARRLSTTITTMDTMDIDALSHEEHIIFVTSTAGQGEPPQNGRTLFKLLNAVVATGAQPLTKMKYSVFAMGDSHYWPRPEDAHFYNRPGKDLDMKLAALGGERFADLGLGDDQDVDGAETGYKVWEPRVWKALGVDSIEIREAEPEPITNEHIKAASSYLRGTIAEGLTDTSTGALAASDTQLTKFHGIYQQDDRDIRDEREAQGVEPAYSFMIRVRLPGGVCSPAQWLAMDQISDEHGSGNFKLTTRQTFQFHGIIKKHLKPSMQAINRSLLDTLAACGDVNRNVLCSAIPSLSELHAQVYAFAKRVSEHLLPRTSAYHEIWLDKKLVAGEALKDFEPLYGEFYLPRKFKVAVAVPPINDVDVFTNDVGFIAIVNERGKLVGFNVTAGGGMGVTHGSKKTYPRTGSILGFVTPEQGTIVAEKIMLVQRDNGNRVDRKNARLKYTIDRMGLDTFRTEVEKLLGFRFQPARPYTFDRNIDEFGWQTGEDGRHHFTCFIENGRVQDEPDRDFKTALREIAKIHKGEFRLTANQHLIISNVASAELPEIKRLLAHYKLDNVNFSGLRLSSSACVAFPTCGLAMAESERYLPLLIDKVEKMCEENGLRNDSIVMRMTGCPNGCARPYVAEVAFVGKAPGTYLMLLGGGYYGQRLNKIYRESVTEPEILAILKPMIKRYALERLDGEHFGDFVIRVGYISRTTEGKAWYEGMGGEGPYREIAV